MNKRAVKRFRACTGALDLAPSGNALKTLADDERRIDVDGLLLDDAASCDVLLQRKQALSIEENARMLRAARHLALISKSASG